MLLSIQCETLNLSLEAAFARQKCSEQSNW